MGWFSSPFIEERLYLHIIEIYKVLMVRSRPLLSRSGCILSLIKEQLDVFLKFSSPFIEERLYFALNGAQLTRTEYVLVPFYRGAVVFWIVFNIHNGYYGSRPLLSRSGCI